jgi:hypothetical protein
VRSQRWLRDAPIAIAGLSGMASGPNGTMFCALRQSERRQPNERSRLRFKSCRDRVNTKPWAVNERIQPSGRRQWFGCLGCRQRCRILYGGDHHGRARFRCRHCHRLRYSSQAETKADRATRGMLRIAKLLDPEQDYNELPPKPKHMRWRSYNRLAERYARYDAQWAAEALRRLGTKVQGW